MVSPSMSVTVASPRRPLRFTASRLRRSRSSGVRRNRDRILAPKPSSPAADASSSATCTGAFMARILQLLTENSRFLKDFVVVFQELIEPFISERMIEQHIYHFERHRANVSAGLRRFHHVQWGTERGRQHLRRKVVVPVDSDDVSNEIHSFGADVIQASNERADNICAGLRRKQRLAPGK